MIEHSKKLKLKDDTYECYPISKAISWVFCHPEAEDKK
jgi:hypothetical protein